MSRRRGGDPFRRRPTVGGLGTPLPLPPSHPVAAYGAREVALLTAAEMQAWDRRAIAERGIAERVLMESAGRATARLVEYLFPAGRIVGVVGGGNNGGDALVALRTLSAWGREVRAVPVAGVELDRSLLHGWDLEVAEGDADAALHGAAVLLDGVLGTGARGAPRPPQAAAIEAMNRCGAPIVALDGPSGLDFTTGQAPGAVVDAAITVTFGALKRGLLLYPGRRHAGRVVAVEIGFPPLRHLEAGAELITPGWARSVLPAVPPNAHKGDLGNVVVVAGSTGVAGAASLVGTGAARAGAGKVYLASTADNRDILQTALPEALFHDRSAEGLRTLLERADAVVVGPGLGTDDEACEILRVVFATGAAPLVVDADAITLCARHPELLEDLTRPALFTPHPGELSRLLSLTVPEIVTEPFAAAAAFLERHDSVLLLKGAPSLVAARGERVLANVVGHSGIATGGMGDTLAGIAAAMLAVGCTPRVAGALALYLSGRAAEIAGRGRSLLPRDVAEALPLAFTEAPATCELPAPEVVLDLAPPH